MSNRNIVDAEVRADGFPLRIGTKVAPWGRIASVGITGGERYYWFVDKHGDVAMMPASVVEAAAYERGTD